MTEFELIARYFDRGARVAGASRVRLGIGDDCALLAPASGHVLAVSTDMLVAGRHFFDDVDAASLGWKALAVNLSDLAAIGATPLGFTLALALPSVDPQWLERFASGLFACADRFACPLVGGDTTRGPLNLCVTILGDVVEATATRRDAATVGDDIWLSGSVGGAAFALRRLATAGDRTTVDASLREPLERPVPRVALGRALSGIAHAAIDVSDGLAQDLGHVLKASGVGAVVAVEQVPCGAALASLDRDDRLRLALAGGDDYELCFTAPRGRRSAVLDAGAASATAVTRIGTIVAGHASRLIDAHGADWPSADGRPLAGFDHFGSDPGGSDHFGLDPGRLDRPA